MKVRVFRRGYGNGWEINLIGRVWNLRIARHQVALWRNYEAVFNFLNMSVRAFALLVLLAAACSTAPAFAEDPTPKPVSGPSLISQANAEGFAVSSQIGAMVVTTAESGTGLTPTLYVDAEGPIAVGEGHSLGRIGARLGLTSSPGQAFDSTDVTNYKGVEVGLRLGRVVGVMGSIRTVVLAEYGFTNLIKGASQARPAQGLSHSFGAGLSFESKDGQAQLAVLPGFDEATTTCKAPLVCTGLHSGFAILIYGQVPILDGKVLFGGDVSIAAAPSWAGVTRTSIERVFIVMDPVRVLKGKPTAPAAASLARRTGTRHAAGFVGPVKES